MLRRICVVLTGCLLLAGIPLRARSAQAAADLDSRVRRAIDRAAGHLWRRHRGGHWDEAAAGAQRRDEGGRTALCVYALLTAGESHQSDRMVKTVQWLRQAELRSVYARSLRALALSMLPGRLGGEELAGDVAWLLDAARPDGAYDYLPSRASGDAWDNSNTQMALLALWSAARRGITIPAAYWRGAEQHWLSTQTGSGGWSYTTARRPAYGSMSAAGLVSLFICLDAGGHRHFLRRGPDTTYPPVQRGMEWMAEHFSAIENPGKGRQYFHYYLFGVLRVGLASGFKRFGGHDWYREGAAELLRTQNPDGGWGELTDTCFALAFLAKGQDPILFCKLRYPGAWNTHPRDLANLTRWIGYTFETSVRWQSLDVAAPEAQWHDAPVLVISGAAAPAFSPADIEKLRAYALKGGLILSEAAGNSPAFTLKMRKVYAELFPGLPLKPIDPAHPVFSANAPLRRPMKLLGVSNGVRLLAIHSAGDLSKPWQANAVDTHRDAFQLAANIQFHATDSASLRRRARRHEQLWPAVPARRPRRRVAVAVLRHEGNWNPEPMARRRLALMMARDWDTELRFSAPMRPAELPPGTFPVALITGTEAFTLTPADTRALRAFARAGGLLVADAAGGKGRFHDAARNQLLTLLDDAYPQVTKVPADSPIYTLPGLGIDRVAFRRAAVRVYGAVRTPQLTQVAVGGRPAIIYSRDDITAGLVGYNGHNIRGYVPDSALALMRNLILYAADRPRPATRPAGD